MRTYIIPAIKLTVGTLIFFSVIYTLVIWSIAQIVAPNNGKGETLNYVSSNDNLKYGYENVGQSFTDDKYFWSRPSAVNYNAAGSGGSNKGPSNVEYLSLVQSRIDTFLVHNPGVDKSEIPVDLITASGSGLDPHLSIQGAIVQVPRLSKLRGLKQEKIIALINQEIERPMFNMFGVSSVNILKLNIALDNLSHGNNEN